MKSEKWILTGFKLSVKGALPLFGEICYFVVGDCRLSIFFFCVFFSIKFGVFITIYGCWILDAPWWTIGIWSVFLLPIAFAFAIVSTLIGLENSEHLSSGAFENNITYM